MATIPASENEFPEVLFAEGAAPGTPAAGLVKAYAKADGLLYSKDDAGVETALGADLSAHTGDTSDAHDASSISVADAGAVFTGTDVEAVLAELQASITGGGIPATIFDAQGDLIVASAADTAARLALGASGTVLTSNGTTAAWAASSYYPLPTITNYAAQFQASSTSCAVTVVAPTAGDNVVAIVYAVGRGANSLTQTNVTWTQRYTGNGNSQYLEVWTGVVSASAGTTVTAAFTGSNTQYVEVFTVNSAAADFTAAAAASTGTAATTALATVSSTVTPGNHYIVATSANIPNTSYSGVSEAYSYLTAFGGLARSGILRANGTRLSYWSLSSSAVNYFTAIISIT